MGQAGEEKQTAVKGGEKQGCEPIVGTPCLFGEGLIINHFTEQVLPAIHTWDSAPE